MKKILWAALAAITALTSCDKAELPGPQDYDVYVTVTCGITAEDPATRSFFDNNATPEPWETEIRSATIFGYTQSGHMVLRHEMTPVELVAGKATLRLLKATYDFYVVANYDVTEDVYGRSKLLAYMEREIEQYNGTAAQVFNASKRAGGFVMTGQMMGVDPTQVQSFLCNLKRTITKIALRVTVAPTLSAAYPNGKLRLDNACMTGMATAATLFSTYSEIRTTIRLNQAPAPSGDNIWENLFYAYWNTPLQASEYPVVTLTGVFDRDGNFATITDQQAVTYKVTLNPEGDGSIRRNGYYRIEARINQLP